MRRKLTTPTLAVLAALAACGGETNDSASCQDVEGNVEASFVETSAMLDENGRPADIEGTMMGDIQAAAYAWVDRLTPEDGLEREPAEPVQVRMRHHYVGDDFTVWTSDEGVLTPLDPPLYRFDNELEATRADGSLAGASGSFTAEGTVNFETGGIQLAYVGRVCL